jgi:methionine synthase II (cobalamin-independent)
MKRRTDRILTTHVGSLPRPPALLDMMKANLTGEGGPVDATVYNRLFLRSRQPAPPA